MKRYYRPLVQCGVKPPGALTLAGGALWFTEVEEITRAAKRFVAADALPPEAVLALTSPRGAVQGLSYARPLLMGILNATPDSFSDGGQFADAEAAIARGQELVTAGADILDVGGESTRPSALTVASDEEIARVVPVIEGLKGAAPVSIDTRKAAVAQAALAAGAGIINDVSGLTYDADMAGVAWAGGAGLVIMHSQGEPETMQRAPRYGDVLLDVYDALEGQVAVAQDAGIAREAIIVDPGIGFGKTMDHNLALLRGLSIFHGLGCPVLVGASRKRFIGTLSGVEAPEARVEGSLAVALGAVAQGAQILRVHDVAETRRALALWQAVHG